MANYRVDRELLLSYLPANTELDTYQGATFVSLIGFMFLDTRVLGMSIPFHIDFEEVNLRFYVKVRAGVEWRRGVVFIREIVPRAAITLMANTLYAENYMTLLMDHAWTAQGDVQTIEYKWKKGRWHSIRADASVVAEDIVPGSEEEFILEHYWGYTKNGSTKTLEYEVAHPKWKVYKTLGASIDVDFTDVYGPDFGFLSKETPASVFLAEGSEISVKPARSLRSE